MVLNSRNTERIVSAAIELFKSAEYKSVMVKDICRKAGISHSSFYSVFSGKDEILVYILNGYKDNFENTMIQLLKADSALDKLWILFEKYMTMFDEFGHSLLSALFELELKGKISMICSINAYVTKYKMWLVRFISECQNSGIIRNSGDAETLIFLGVRLSLLSVYEWCASGGSYSLKDRAFEEMEVFYDIAPQHRGVRPA